MNEIINPTTIVTMSSREIAELVEVRHDSVKRAIERMAARGVVSFTPAVETSHDGAGARPVEVYFVGKRDSYVIVAQLSPEFTARLVDRWQELEGRQAPVVALSRMDILKLAMESEQARIQAESERDEAIRTKAQIGRQREATAMATASRASREVSRLRDELGHNARHATIIAVERASTVQFHKNAYVELRRWCKQKGIKAAEVADPRYGTVKAWPAGAWMDVYGIDLCKLFAEDRA